MSVHTVKFKAVPKQGVTYEQAMEIFKRSFMPDICQAVPTIAHELNISYKTCCDVLDGKIWPEAYRIWVNRVLP